MRAILACAVALAVSAAVLFADDHSVIFDEDVDFSTFATFAIGEGHMASARPELNFPAVMQSLGGAIRLALTTRGLKEVPDHADLVAAYDVTGVDYAIGPFGRPNAIQPSSGRRMGRAGSLPVDFTEITLVVDLNHGTPAALVWRGVYHDTEKAARKLAEALPKDATSLLAEYPPKKAK
jgi:Domain of unknown function (DUF4136)